jgi:chaperonin GroEL (HSP60 family)
VLVELAELQDREVGDGTTSVVIFAAELLKVMISEILLISYGFLEAI